MLSHYKGLLDTYSNYSIIGKLIRFMEEVAFIPALELPVPPTQCISVTSSETKQGELLQSFFLLNSVCPTFFTNDTTRKILKISRHTLWNLSIIFINKLSLKNKHTYIQTYSFTQYVLVNVKHVSSILRFFFHI